MKEREDSGFARDFESLDPPPSEGELLHYINHKVGHTNKLLGEIKMLLTFLLIGLAGLAGALWRKGII